MHCAKSHAALDAIAAGIAGFCLLHYAHGAHLLSPPFPGDERGFAPGTSHMFNQVLEVGPFGLETFPSYLLRAYLLSREISSNDIELFTDAAGSAGFGAILGMDRCFGEWPDSWRDAGFC